ncbi:MAG: c-type cytochrome [Thiohalomonadaceae bacterium]
MFRGLVLAALLAATGSVMAADGAKLYGRHCAACHGLHGEGGVGVPLALPDFLSTADDDFLRKTLRNGRPGRVMPAFRNLSDAEIDALVAHLRSFARPGAPAPRAVSNAPVKGDAAKGRELFARHCAACHGAHGEGGHGTGVTFSRPRDLPIMPPALNNPGFLAAASDAMIKATLMRGRDGTPMISFLDQGLSEQDIDDIVSFVRSFEQAAPSTPRHAVDEPMVLEAESSYSLEETVENVKRAAIGKNFRIIREQTLEQGFFAEGEENAKQVIVYFCNFNFINQALSLDPRVGLFLPCRVTVVEHEGVVKVLSINPRHLSALYNNRELDAACDEMTELYKGILEEATL